jgi:protein O-GlcNAc transferase
MPITSSQIQEAVAQANAALQRGNLARADLICQTVLAQGVRPVEIILIEGRVAIAIGEYATARRYFEEILASNPAHSSAANALSDLNCLQHKTPGDSKSAQRFHLIKAWGNGFTADLDHTLGHLLLAEMTGRTPVIHWGRNSLFRDANVENAWLEFFEAVSPFTIADLGRGDHTFFPAKWTADHLMREEINKMSGPGSRTAGILFLNQGASVTVGDFFTSVIELLPWVCPPHPLAVEGIVNSPAIEGAYRYLIGKYLKPRAEIVAAVESFAAQYFLGKEVLAVHVRGSDKITEAPKLPDGQRRVFEEVKTQLTSNPGLSVFLLTDDAKLREQYVSAFPGRVIMTDCIRSDTTTGVHHQPAGSRRQLGFEILTDVYLAARCDRLLGLGFTNVSNYILHLKQWPPGSARLLGMVTHYHRNFLLHS